MGIEIILKSNTLPPTQKALSWLFDRVSLPDLIMNLFNLPGLTSNIFSLTECGHVVIGYYYSFEDIYILYIFLLLVLAKKCWILCGGK